MKFSKAIKTLKEKLTSIEQSHVTSREDTDLYAAIWVVLNELSDERRENYIYHRALRLASKKLNDCNKEKRDWCGFFIDRVESDKRCKWNNWIV